MKRPSWPVDHSLGRTLAEWIVSGRPQMDLSHVDVARFHPFQVTGAPSSEKISSSPETLYPCNYTELTTESNSSAKFNRPTLCVMTFSLLCHIGVTLCSRIHEIEQTLSGPSIEDNIGRNLNKNSVKKSDHFQISCHKHPETWNIVHRHRG